MPIFANELIMLVSSLQNRDDRNLGINSYPNFYFPLSYLPEGFVFRISHFELTSFRHLLLRNLHQKSLLLHLNHYLTENLPW